MAQLTLSELVGKVRVGGRISADEAVLLYQKLPLVELGTLAQEVRNRAAPADRVSYLIDRNINYTNICNTDCSFCGFYRHSSKDPESYVLSREVLKTKTEEAIERGATRILLQGGHNDELPYSYYLDLIEWMHANFQIELNAFSPSEIDQMSKISGKSWRIILEELQARGLKGLPGGGAEILDDDIRKVVSPKKLSADKWIAVMEDAQQLGLTTTASMVIGFGETIQQRVNHFKRLRDLQDRSQSKGLQGFGAFISWPLQHNENTSIGRSKRASSLGAGGVEYLRNTALARIFLDNIPHHQASWPTLGAELAAVALHMGCDDFGSTMMEENVVSQAGAPTEYKCSMSVDELHFHIRRAGFRPAQRNSSFEIVKEWDR